jgi:flagellar biosynthetic protein FliR
VTLITPSMGFRMTWSMEFCLEHAATCALVAVRIAALVVFAPLFGSFAVPLRVRLLVALALTALVFPLEASRPIPIPDALAPFLAAAAGEALVGFLLGLGVVALFSALQVAGQLIGQASGVQFADMFGGPSPSAAPLFARLLTCVATAVFLTIGGHRRAIGALLDTFAWLPAGQGGVSRPPLESVTLLVAQSFVLGVRAAAPAVVALLLATLAIALASRALPQLNALGLGLGVSALAALVAVGISLAAACWLFQDQLDVVLAVAQAAIRPQ